MRARHGRGVPPPGIAVNALWPRTVIATAALQIIPGATRRIKGGRTPEIMADAAHGHPDAGAARLTGNFLIDEEVLREAGVADFAATQ